MPASPLSLRLSLSLSQKKKGEVDILALRSLLSCFKLNLFEKVTQLVSQTELPPPVFLTTSSYTNCNCYCQTFF